MISRTHLLLPLSCAAVIATASEPKRAWTDEVIYFALTDRFFDGDDTNNIPQGSEPGLFDPRRQDINRYHGGDLRGLEKAIQSGYFGRLGVTALWLTPPVRNVWKNPHDFGAMKTGYHGYWAQDFLDIDPHLVSRKTLDGTKDYPDTREGRLSHYRDFIALARSRGIRIIQDVVLNHAGPVFHYDTDDDGVFDHELADEWVQPFQRDAPYTNARWAEVPPWNFRRAEPSGPVTIFGKPLSIRGAPGDLSSFSRRGFNPDSLGKSDGEEVWADFTSLRDYDTSPGSPHFDALVDDFVEIYRFYMEEIGVDGLRVDTVKHVHHAFWDAFTARLRAKLGPKAADVILFGEVYDGNPAALGKYTWREDAASNPAPSLDSTLDFQFCFAVREFLRQAGAHGPASAVETALKTRLDGKDTNGRAFYNTNAGADGLTSIQKAISFVENHDGLNRFRVRGISEARHLLAQAVLLTSPGIPCLYYGAEAALADERGEPGKDGETGRMTLFAPGALRTPIAVEASRAFQVVAGLTDLRARHPALRSGDWRPLWADSPDQASDDGTLVYARSLPNDPGSTMVVVIHAGERPGRIEGIRLPEGIEGWLPIRLPGYHTPSVPERSGNGAWNLGNLPPETVCAFIASPDPAKP
ncbi:MAG: alpha-amylase family glycosyl hydrolase [Verrucomicrobiales bacterium]